MEQESEQLAQALLHSKADVPAWSNDGVVILRLTRMARSPLVLGVLHKSPALSHCRQLVEDAGCSMEPPWAGGAKLLVPLTREQLQEASIELSDNHIVALATDVEVIKSALAAINFKKRPKLAVENGEGLQKRARGSEMESSDRSAPWPNNGGGSSTDLGAVVEDPDDDFGADGLVDAVIETEWPDTDSNHGLPTYTSAARQEFP